MATIREKSAGRWQAQIRRKGWPYQAKTFSTKRDAEIWVRTIESQMDHAVFVDQGIAKQTSFGDHIEDYIVNVTRMRPSADSAIGEEARLRRFKKAESALCAYSVANLKPEHFEDYRDRRLRQKAPKSRKPTVHGRANWQSFEKRTWSHASQHALTFTLISA
tara:strand:- start:621 stop:1106 length:486 start_codon:yes stop_codon:yes gene_type:complete